MAGAAALLTVACVLHVPATGRCDYDAAYVGKLQRGVARHLPIEHRFVCLSNVEVPCERIPLEHGWGHWWAKLETFRPDIEADRILYFDLDTVIVGDLGDIAARERLTMLADFNVPAWLQSGVMMLPQDARARAWDEWIRDPAAHIVGNPGHGDAGFLRRPYQTVATKWQDVLPGQIVSYKNHVRPNDALPTDARVVCFHGKPRPADLPPDHWLRSDWQ